MARTVRGARVLITGAAGSTGRMYAERAIAECAASVTLWDVDAAALSRTASELGSASRGRTRIHSFVVDVADLGAIAKTAQKVRRDIGNPDILINNAGIARGSGYFWQTDNGEDTRPTMQVNALAPMYITREFLPEMLANAYRPARIVNVAAAVANPRTPVYEASKAALASWSGRLGRELDAADHGNVKVTTVTSPSMAASLTGRRPDPTPIVDPRHVVDRVWRAMLHGRAQVPLPWSVGFARMLRGASPARVSGRVLGDG
jgi:all-trans-retinol dehydrogenase (NAD+)